MKNILIAVSGLTPQIISETFFCLAVKKKIQINEILVITTARGRDIILGNDNEYNKKRKYPPLEKELKRMCIMYKLKPPVFTSSNIKVANEQSIELYDIRDDKHNILFPNKVCEIIKEKTNDKNSVLHCSISGGRKTMSVDLAFALSLFGRMEDKLYHVLIDESLEFSKFFPESKSEAKKLEIAEIPYVRLRPLLGEITKNKVFTKMSYIELVKYTQQQLKIKSADVLYINSRRREIFFGSNEPVKLEPKKFDLYCYLINIKREGRETESIVNLAERICEDAKKMDVILQYNNKVNSKIKEAINDPEIEPLFKISGPKEFGERQQYGIIADLNKFRFLD
ncbi:MAG: CRISPR-associated ring nuclease Csm6 [Ignavibacteria bacterium]|nr:CRISPR-associated ring nuclease Csm6 [Ignavibacteria bacterium]